ncbi:hypothetical protein GOODEAATRI_030154 [Goodea atripinnis]|uniref:Uncharacterized protein n=1 Tax=Goodea atripinnis TaxID=208336 RepID=A0ABV0PID4_9TELE
MALLWGPLYCSRTLCTLRTSLPNNRTMGISGSIGGISPATGARVWINWSPGYGVDTTELYLGMLVLHSWVWQLVPVRLELAAECLVSRNGPAHTHLCVECDPQDRSGSCLQVDLTPLLLRLHRLLLLLRLLLRSSLLLRHTDSPRTLLYAALLHLAFSDAINAGLPFHQFCFLNCILGFYQGRLCFSFCLGSCCAD